MTVDQQPDDDLGVDPTLLGVTDPSLFNGLCKPLWKD